MSDENEVRKIALEFFKDKFQPLYNKQKELTNLIQGNAISDLNHYEVNKNRISELEASSASHTENEDGLRRHLTELEGWTENFTEDMATKLTELQESDLAREEHIQRLEGCVSDCQKELNELKEYFDLDSGHMELHRESTMNRKVLRELIDLEYHHYTMGQLFGDAHKFEALLEKLDVGSASARESLDRQMEKHITWQGGSNPYEKTGKKDPYIELQKEIFDDSDEFPFEDLETSGGEKVQNITPCNFSNCDEIGTNKYNGRMFCEHHYIQLTTLPNSKPPEPKQKWKLKTNRTFQDDYRFKKEYTQEYLDCKIKETEDRLPGGTGTEPKPGEHFIMRDDGTPNNPILRALFFGGDEEYIIDWKFRYKRKYYEIVKREEKLK